MEKTIWNKTPLNETEYENGHEWMRHEWKFIREWNLSTQNVILGEWINRRVTLMKQDITLLYLY